MKNLQIKPLIPLAGAFYLRGVSKVAKGNFGCTAAPPRARIGKDAKGSFAQRALNRQKSREAGFFSTLRLSKLSLACLLTALLALPHCSSDDNGGGGGSDAVLNAIYLWVTGCLVRGADMSGDSSFSPRCPDPAGAPANGPERADAICANQYESDVDETPRDRIAQEGEPRHTALLARSNDLPKEVFPVRGKDTLEIKRPDETLIADSWDQFFDPSVDLSTTGGVSVTGTNVQYWTGWFVEADQFTPRGSGGDSLYCGNPGDGSGGYWTAFTDARVGKGDVTGPGRLDEDPSGCGNGSTNASYILCIAH